MSLYSDLLKKGKDALKGISDVIATRKDKRAFKSAYDNLLEKKDKASQAQNGLYEKVGFYADNLPKILEYANEIRSCEITIELLKKEYKKVFGCEFKVEDDE